MLAATRNRVVRLFEDGEPATADLIRAVESDLALTIHVMRLANKREGTGKGTVDSVVQAVDALSAGTVLAAAQILVSAAH